MIRINLLPHREMRRERRKKEFVGMAVVAAASAAVAALAVGAVINELSAQQTARNEFLKVENAKLDEQIKEIANLRAEIESLKARQQAVENLQSDRTLPVHLMDELVRVAPDGMHFRTVRQEELKVTITGYAQSNERVSELLRNLAYNAPWLERPELGEIKLVSLSQAGTRDAKDARRAYEFSLNALLKRPARADDKAKDDKAAKMAGAAPGTPAAAATPAAAVAAVAAPAVAAAAAPAAAPAAAAPGAIVPVSTGAAAAVQAPLDKARATAAVASTPAGTAPRK